jgi:hypothetical protein
MMRAPKTQYVGDASGSDAEALVRLLRCVRQMGELPPFAFDRSAQARHLRRARQTFKGLGGNTLALARAYNYGRACR